MVGKVTSSPLKVPLLVRIFPAASLAPSTQAMSMSDLSTATPPLTILSEEETLFRDAVREFAETEVRPHVQ